jgi:hypothetical protein
MWCVTPREQIKLFCPTLGKLKIAEKLARAGSPNLPVAMLRTGLENGEQRGDRRRVEKGRASLLRLYSLLSPLSCSIAAMRQWRRRDGLAEGLSFDTNLIS